MYKGVLNGMRTVAIKIVHGCGPKQQVCLCSQQDCYHLHATMLALLLLPAVQSLRDCLLACASGGTHAELPAGLWLQARFAREIALLKCCSDENIVSFLGASLKGDSLVLVMVSSSMIHGPQLWASSLILTGLPAID